MEEFDQSQRQAHRTQLENLSTIQSLEQQLGQFREKIRDAACLEERVQSLGTEAEELRGQLGKSEGERLEV